MILRSCTALIYALAIHLATVSICEAAPTVFWASDPVGPDETALIVGDEFGTGSKVTVRRLPDNPDSTSSKAGIDDNEVEAEILQATDQSLKFVIPKQFKAGVFAYRITNKNGTTTGRLNVPTVYWLQGDGANLATPGGWIRILGRCISQGPQTALSLSREGDANIRTLRPKTASTWDAAFEVPADTPAGVYRARIWNGTGDSSAWSDAGHIEIRPAKPLPAKIFNVKEFGAIGNGVAEDTKAVKAALDAAAANGGGIVLFPRGRYVLTDTLTIPPFLTLRGERRDLVNLAWKDTEKPPEFMIQGSANFAIEDITIYASNHLHIISGGFNPPGIESGHIRLQRITIRASAYRGHLKPEDVDRRFREIIKATGDGGDSIRLSGPNLVITDSDIYGSARSLFLQRPRGAYIARNRFYNGRLGWYSVSGADKVIFEDNEIMGADLLASGGSINNLRGNTLSQNVLFLRNKFSLMHGWDREAMTSDAGGGFYYGSIQSADERHIVIAGTPSRSASELGGWKGAGVFILGGKGMGQLAQIDQIEGNSITLDRAWKVLPDASSVLTITMLQQNYLLVDNEFSDAGVAIQFYGTSINHVVVGNKSTRTDGFFNTGRWYQHYQPSWYIQFLDNQIIEGNVYRSGSNNAVFSGEAILGSMGYQRAPNTAPLTLGSIHRRNALRNNAHIEVVGTSVEWPGIRDVIIENNTVENADHGLLIDAGVQSVLTRYNKFKNVSEAIVNRSVDK